MSTFIKTCILFLISGVINFHSIAQSTLTPRLDSVLQLARQRGVLNGNVLVAQKGKIIYQGSFGYANPARTIALNPGFRFDIGSITKEFNGVSIMILKEQGKLKLDDPVSKYLPYLPAWAQKVKIKNLINYTSGIPNVSATSDESDQEINAVLMNLKELKFEPGSAYIYCHFNVYLQMRIIEKVSGMSYAAFVAKHIFKPCKMSSASIDAPLNGKGMAVAFDNNYQPAPYAQAMSGWVRLTAMDLYKWMQCLESYQLISKTSFKELSINFPGGESSLGSAAFENEALTWHQHQGSNSNYEAVIYSDLKTDIRIIIMTNNQNLKVYGIKSAILAVLKNEPVTVPKKSVYLDMREKAAADLEKGIAFYRDLRAKHQDSYDFSFEAGDLINTGKYLLRRNKSDDAICLFQLATLISNIKAADLSYAYELTGEAYLKKGSKNLAAMYYSKAFSTDPNNKNSAAMLENMNKDQVTSP